MPREGCCGRRRRPVALLRRSAYAKTRRWADDAARWRRDHSSGLIEGGGRSGLQRSGEMNDQRIVEFRTPIVREMTDVEYREQRRRVAASVLLDRTADDASDRRSPYVGTAA